MWFLAIRQLIYRKKQTLLVTGGILLGTAAYVAFSGVMLGFQNYMVERLINSGGHLKISARAKEISEPEINPALFPAATLVHWLKRPSGRRDSERIDHPAGWFTQLDSDPRVLSYSPQLSIQALASRGALSASVTIVGIEPQRHVRVTNLNDFIKNGTLVDLGHSGNRVIVGSGLLAKLGSSIGESILLTSASGTNESFRIVNDFELGVPQTDDTTLFASIADVQKLNQSPSQVTAILVRLVDLALASSVASNYSLYSTDKIESWKESNQGILSVFDMQDLIRNLMSACILLVAGFGIYNVLNMIVSQKKKEIGILRSMGYTGSEVSRLFLIQGLIFGTVGGSLGLVAGYLFCRYMGTLHIGVPGSAAFRNMMIAYDGAIYVRAFFLSLAASIFAGWIPARSAGKMNPIDIIRTEGA